MIFLFGRIDVQRYQQQQQEMQQVFGMWPTIA